MGRLLFFLGWFLVVWSAGVGLSFYGIFLMGFVGTGGPEAGGQLVARHSRPTAGSRGRVGRHR